MNKTFHITINHLARNSEFLNCSVTNAIGILQTEMYMRGLDIPKITVPVFWDMYFKRDNSLHTDLRELIKNRDIIIK